MQPAEFTIGRDHTVADIVPEGENLSTVSRRHARVRQETESGLFRVEDLDSANGLFVMQHGEWKRIQKGRLAADIPVRFGFLETTFARLMPQINALRQQHHQVQGKKQSSGKHPRRNPETGEIIV